MLDPLRNVPVRYKLALTFAGVCLLAFGVGGFLVSRSAVEALEYQIRTRLAQQSDAYAAALEGELRTLGQRARDFASDGYIRTQVEDLADASTAERTLQLGKDLRTHLIANKLPIVPAFRNIAVLRTGGELFLALPGERKWAEGHGALPVERESYGSLLDPEAPPAPPTFTIAAPLLSLSGERLVGHLLVQVDAGTWLASSLASMVTRDAPSLGLRVIDASGGSLEVPRHILERSSDPSGDLMRTGFGLRIERDPIRPPAGSTARGVFSRRQQLAAVGWKVETRLDSRAALSPVSGLQARFVLVGSVLTLLACLFLIFPMRFLARPLFELREAARRIADGDFGSRVAVTSTDEIGELSQSFNVMASAVEERTSRLERSAADLEQRKDELRRERDRLNAVISSMRDGLLVLDPDGEPEVWNRAAGPLIEMAKRRELEPSGHHSCSNERNTRAGPPTDRGTPTNSEAVKRDNPCVECLFAPAAPPRSCLVDVGTRVFEIHSTRLAPDATGRAGRVLVSLDVTDRIGGDEREIHQERLAVLGEVAAVVAHELNNPLAAITMFNQMLQSELPADSPLQENVSVIERNSLACKQTIRELLDYATGATPEVGPVDVHATLEDVTRFLRALAQRKQVQLTLDLAAEEPDVEGDEVQLRQVFVNLIMNAIQAVDADGGHVLVRTLTEAGHLVVEVSDDGPGIPVELVDEVFKPFYTTKPRGKGTGLGLPTARRITEIQGGGLELLDPAPGNTTFQVRLLRSAS